MLRGESYWFYIGNVGGHLGPKSRHFSAIPDYIGHDCSIYMHSRNYTDMYSLELIITRVESSPVVSATRLFATHASNYWKYPPAKGCAQALRATNKIKSISLLSCCLY